MHISEIDERWGPVERVVGLEEGAKEVSAGFFAKAAAKNAIDKIQEVFFVKERDESMIDSDEVWKLLGEVGIPEDEITRIQKKMEKMKKKQLPLAKL